MVVAKRKYDYLEPQEQQQQKPIQRQKPKKNYRFEKIMMGFGIITVLSISLVLLIRFATITEAKHRIHHLHNQLEQLETQKEHLRVEVERVSKSRWIEREAKDRLNMQYPLPEQIIYISVDPIETAMLRNQLNNNEEEIYDKGGSGDTFNKIFSRFVGLFKI
ncbi:cell division protein FtsL [Natronincola ferrireducens]|uniref:Cell division protein FtsL n=1 Tax=Natronincola ferrireducens TaxID=393762 RepID=A0A1G9BN46_9FIRM|nr:cell division protein FtsL [Natronincola ferrireducens]SDK40285.1 Cell division protein FtsL [Natronincola ferrireducens]